MPDLLAPPGGGSDRFIERNLPDTRIYGERVWGFDRFPRQPQVLYNIFISLLVFPADRFSQAAKTERGPRGVHFEETVNLRPLPLQMRCLQLTDT